MKKTIGILALFLSTSAFAADATTFLGVYEGKTPGLFPKPCKVTIALNSHDWVTLKATDGKETIELGDIRYHLNGGIASGENPIHASTDGGLYKNANDADIYRDRDGKITKVVAYITPFFPIIIGSKTTVKCSKLVRAE